MLFRSLLLSIVLLSVYATLAKNNTSAQSTDITDVRAERYAVVSTESFVCRGGVLSPDGDLVVCVGNNIVRIINPFTLSTVKEYEVETGGDIRWSSDKKHLRVGRIILDLDTGDTVVLPANFPESEIPYTFIETNRLKSNKNGDISNHKYVWMYRSDLILPSLKIQNRDLSYSRILINNIYNQHPWVTDPMMRYVIARDTIYYFGLRADPHRYFRAELDKNTAFTSSDRERFDKDFQSEDEIIAGEVYSPMISPFDGTTTGRGERNTYKGDVVFLESYDNYSIVRTRFEHKPIEDGDVVTHFYEIYSTRPDYVGRSTGYDLNLGRAWAVLRVCEECQENENLEI